MSEINYLTEEQVQELIKEVEKDFEALAKSAAPMKKDDDKDPMAPVVSEDAAPEAPAGDTVVDEGGAPEAGAPAEEAPSEVPAEMADGQAPVDQAAPEAEAPAMEEPQQEGMSMEDLQAAYAELQPDEFIAHFEAINAVAEAKWAAEAQAAAPEGGVEPQQEAPTEAPAQEAPLAASEKPADKKPEDCAKDETMAEGAPEGMAKSEREVELEAATASLVAILESKLPERKGIVAAAQLEKSEQPLQKSVDEVYAEAKALIPRRDLTKSERDVLNDFFIDRRNDKPVRALLTQKVSK